MKPAYYTFVRRKANKKARFKKSQARWFRRIKKLKEEMGIENE